MSLTLKELRNIILNHYNSLSYKIQDSAPLIHPYFPMSFNMSAGFVQLEPFINGDKKIENYKITTIQKCIRHFDLNKAGSDNSHMTFFEMWGALTVSKVDREADISEIWNFLTKKLNIPLDKLAVTVFKGGRVKNLHFEKDILAENMWQNTIKINKNQIFYGDETNTFLFQGGSSLDDQTKKSLFSKKLCGYQTEIFFDKTGKACSPQCSPFCDCDRWLEIANNLSISHQYNPETKKLNKLTIPATETVFGVERLLSALENKNDVFGTTTFKVLFDYLSKHTNLSYENQKKLIDRLRALYFLGAEDIPNPGKNGRNRIVRTMLRDTFSLVYFVDIQEKLEIIEQLFALFDEIYLEFYPELYQSGNKIYNMIIEYNKVYKKTVNHASESIKNSLIRKEKISDQLGLPKFLINKLYKQHSETIK